VFSLNFGIPRLPGIPHEAEAIAGFEQRYGYPMPWFSFYLAVAAAKILMLSIRDHSNGKTVRQSDALPDFPVGRVQLCCARYRTCLALSNGR
jgi:hypothetical protein